MWSLKKSVLALFIVTLAGCMSQFDEVQSNENSEKSVDESWNSTDQLEDQYNLYDCGYQEIVVDNPDKTKTIIIIPLECVDEPVDIVCDPSLEDPTKRHEACVAEKINL